MPKLTKRDIVVAISNQTGMVQHDVFEVVQRTLDQTACRPESQRTGQQFCDPASGDREIQGWQNHAPARGKTFTRIEGSVRTQSRRAARERSDCHLSKLINQDRTAASGSASSI